MANENISKKRTFFDFMIYFIIKVKNDDIFALGAQLAYYMILSFFPFLIFLMTLIGFSGLNSMQIIEGLRAILPSSVLDLTASIIFEVVENQYTGLLGASIILVMWSASSAFRAVIKGINKAYNVKETRSFIKRVIIALICTFALAFIIVVTLALLVFGDLLGGLITTYLPFDKLIQNVWNILRYTAVISIMVCIFAAIYRYTPSKRIRWKEVFPGAIATTMGWIIVSLAFSFYINNFSNYSRLYGSLGAMFALMTWLYITSIIFILGGEINSVIVIRKNNLSIK